MGAVPLGPQPGDSHHSARQTFPSLACLSPSIAGPFCFFFFFQLRVLVLSVVTPLHFPTPFFSLHLVIPCRRNFTPFGYADFPSFDQPQPVCSEPRRMPLPPSSFIPCICAFSSWGPFFSESQRSILLIPTSQMSPITPLPHFLWACCRPRTDLPTMNPQNMSTFRADGDMARTWPICRNFSTVHGIR